MLNRLSQLAALALATSAAALNIILTNDDSWASANIRATYEALKADGHNVLLIGPAVQQSGKGGTFVLPTTNITAPGGEFGTIPVGAPYYGQDLNDSSIRYLNGTPAACAIYGLDIIAPTFFKNQSVDLLVSGPNEGQNNGPFLYALSGTIGAAYTAVGRGIPSIAFSAQNGTHRSYTTNTGLPSDPANLAGRLAANLVAALANGIDTSKERLLPLGVGLSVNLPLFGPTSNCTEPPFTLTRMTGGAVTNKVVIDPSTGFPIYQNVIPKALNTAYNGVPILPGESIVSATCRTAVSVFSIDYDAPSKVAEPVQLQLLPVVGTSKLA
ncbi:5'/3'-nucleotidase sure [Cristinia sonorae]|uniref:5'/3'-nucleotidase sure n=1 Tax=Cristinia sonorae TaxID=1940300 RepID=A0A8K0US43_9AGAR|nr:5'/3'-nucleotidase sure [Cristinia sonorae]